MDPALYQLKVAAAVSVLRSKPVGVGARQYTEQLCAKYACAQSHWRARYLQAQEALVHYRQQQVIQAIQVQQLESNSADDSIGCLPTPPLSAPENGGGDLSVDNCSISALTADQALVSSFQFIHSVVSLAGALQVDRENPSSQNKEVTGEGDVQRNKTIVQQLHPSQLGSLLADTVPVCVRHLRQIVSDGKSQVSTHCVMQGVDGLVLLVNTDWSELVGGVHYEQFLLEQLGGLVDDLFHQLFETKPARDEMLMCVRTRQLLHQMLLRLTTQLRAPQKYSVLHSIATVSRTLCRSLTDANCGAMSTKPNTHTSEEVSINEGAGTESYERLGIALDCLQKGVQSLKLGELHAESLQELQMEMESVVDSSLMQQFPLVSHTLFRLTSVIEQCSRCENTS